MKRKYSCKDCGKTGFANAWAVRNHKIEEHGAPARKGHAQRETAAPAKRKRRAGGRRAGRPRKVSRQVDAAPDAPVVDAESKLIASVCDLFVNAGTDRDADARVISYIGSRFGPEAYANEE